MYIVQKYLLKFVVLFSMMILGSYAFDTSNTTFSNDISEPVNKNETNLP